VNILVTGGNGYIAKSLVRAFSDKHNITSVTRNDFDLSDPVLTSEWFRTREFDVVVHTAAVGGSRLCPDGPDVLRQNLMMYYNLLSNKKSFGRLISFGSGAELFHKETPYGMSKKIISESIKETDNFYNLRIFGVFDENELDRRFIKSNIQCYLNKKPMIIHSEKIMDFFYMKDLISLVEYYIENNNPKKEINCSYETKKSLREISSMINQLDSYEVPVIVMNEEIDFYCGVSNLPIEVFGLKFGIEEMFLKMNVKD
jgi:nucleoside-diphosphate-sugar epimerase